MRYWLCACCLMAGALAWSGCADSNTRARALLRQGKYQLVLKHASGEDADALRLRGVAYWRLGRIGRGRAMLLMASELDPGDHQIQRDLGRLELEQENFGAARQHLQRAHALGDGSAEIQRPLATLVGARVRLFEDPKGGFASPEKRAVELRLAAALGVGAITLDMLRIRRSCTNLDGWNPLRPREAIQRCPAAWAREKVLKHRRRALVAGCGTPAVVRALAARGCHEAASELIDWAVGVWPTDWRWRAEQVRSALSRQHIERLDPLLTAMVFHSPRRAVTALAAARLLAEFALRRKAAVWAVKALALTKDPRIGLQVALLLARWNMRVAARQALRGVPLHYLPRNAATRAELAELRAQLSGKKPQ